MPTASVSPHTLHIEIPENSSRFPTERSERDPLISSLARNHLDAINTTSRQTVVPYENSAWSRFKNRAVITLCGVAFLGLFGGMLYKCYTDNN